MVFKLEIDGVENGFQRTTLIVHEGYPRIEVDAVNRIQTAAKSLFNQTNERTQLKSIGLSGTRSCYNCKRTWAICVHAPNGGTKRTELESTQVPIGTESLPLYQVISHQDNLNGLHEIGVAVDMMLPLVVMPTILQFMFELFEHFVPCAIPFWRMLFLEPPCRTRLRWFNHGI